MESRRLKKHRSDQPPIILDKHIDVKAIAPLFHSVVRSANDLEPSFPYEGTHTDDEDFFEVLQIVREERALLITADGAFFGKVQIFQEELAPRKKDRCFNGVLIVPKERDRQVALVRSFVAGELDVRLAGSPKNRVSLAFLYDSNLGLDLRAKVPVAVELCRCRWEDEA